MSKTIPLSAAIHNQIAPFCPILLCNSPKASCNNPSRSPPPPLSFSDKIPFQKLETKHLKKANKRFRTTFCYSLPESTQDIERSRSRGAGAQAVENMKSIWSSKRNKRERNPSGKGFPLIRGQSISPFRLFADSARGKRPHRWFRGVKTHGRGGSRLLRLTNHRKKEGLFAILSKRRKKGNLGSEAYLLYTETVPM